MKQQTKLWQIGYNAESAVGVQAKLDALNKEGWRVLTATVIAPEHPNAGDQTIIGVDLFFVLVKDVGE
jgi:hypothetical protein